MNRRRFMTVTTAAAAAAAWPSWLRRAVASDCEIDRAAGELFAAYLRARQARRPLLVLVFPEDSDPQYIRGRAFGEWLNHGSDEQIAPLGLAEVICATMTTREGEEPRPPPKPSWLTRPS